jgi:hypothetical protein
LGYFTLRKEEVEVTDLQIKYQSLLLDRHRVEEELALNKQQISEVERHNLAVEQNARDQIAIGWHEAETARYNAETNRLNYSVNAYNAETNRMNAKTNQYNAETNRLNYFVNKQNAATNWYNAQTQRGYLELQKEMQPYTIELTKAQTASQLAGVRDIDAKLASGYWATHSAKNVTSALADLGRTVDDASSLFSSTGATRAANAVQSSVPTGWSPDKSTAAKRTVSEVASEYGNFDSSIFNQMTELYKFVTQTKAPWDSMKANSKEQKEQISVFNSLRQLGNEGANAWKDFVDFALDKYSTIEKGLAPFTIPYWVEQASNSKRRSSSGRSY